MEVSFSLMNLSLEATCLHALPLTSSSTLESNIDPHAKLTLDMTLWCPSGWSCLQNARAPRSSPEVVGRPAASPSRCLISCEERSARAQLTPLATCQLGSVYFRARTTRLRRLCDSLDTQINLCSCVTRERRVLCFVSYLSVTLTKRRK